MSDAILHSDGIARCPWCGVDQLYQSYHDAEWGIPIKDPKQLFAKLILDGFQAGLSWLTILRKRQAFLTAFLNFEPELLVKFNEAKIAELMNNSAIVRHRLKIISAIKGAKAYLNIEATEGFSHFIWKHVDFHPVQHAPRKLTEIKTSSKSSDHLSRSLKSAGFSFCGTTISYAFMQAAGLVNDHLHDCHRFEPIRNLGTKFSLTTT